VSTKAPNLQVLGKVRLVLKSLALFFAPPVPPKNSEGKTHRLFLSLATAREQVYKVAANFKLGTKFLISFVVITTVLMCLTLLVVGHEARTQVDQQIEEQSSRTILMFQVMEHQHQISLSHKAELLASLAAMRNGDPTAVASASDDPWQSEDCNLFLMTDAAGKVAALHTSEGDFPAADAERLLQNMLKRHLSSSWWVSGTQLYQVVLRPVIAGPEQGGQPLGTVVVGRAIDSGVVSELRRVSSSEVAFRNGNQIIVSTFSPLEESQLEKQAGSGMVPQQIQIDEQKYIASSVNLSDGANASQTVSLVMLKSYNDALAFLNRLNRLLIGLLLAAVLVGAMLVLFVADTFTRPLNELVGGVRALEQGDFDYPLHAHGGDEVAQVTRAFGRMRTTLQTDEAERRKLEDQLRRAQRMEAMGRLAGGVAHDFNNLLTVIKGHSDVLLSHLPAETALGSSTQQIAKAADRAAALTRQLLIFSRRQATQPRVLDLNFSVSEMGKLLKRLVREDINFVFRPGESIGHLRADPCHLEQVIMNLVVNASDAMPSGGNLTVETYDVNIDEKMAQAQPPLKSGEYVVLAVTDTGCGMDENTKAHIFEPFFTTKGEGKGTGLGLATVYGAVKQSNGFVLVESEIGKGTRFEVYLPRVEEPVDPLFAPRSVLSMPPRTETVLIAEDEDAVRELASEFARSAGYQVLAARDGLEALAIAQSATQPVHILLTDVVLPHIRGPRMAQSFRERMPELKVVFMSGYLEYQKEEGILPGDLFLQKPFTRDALIQKLEEALAKPTPSSATGQPKPVEPELAKAIS
jgi:signal transduction histidine kinase/ActR/RegA family two-component response regulator